MGEKCWWHGGGKNTADSEEVDDLQNARIRSVPVLYGLVTDYGTTDRLGAGEQKKRGWMLCIRLLLRFKLITKHKSLVFLRTAIHLSNSSC